MKITPEFLTEIGFKQQKNSNGILVSEWYWHRPGRLYTIKGGPVAENEYQWRFYPPGAMDPDYHYITTVEEMLDCTFENGKECGKEELRQAFRELIGVKE